MELYEHQPYIDKVIADAEASAYLSQNVYLAAVTYLRSHPEKNRLGFILEGRKPGGYCINTQKNQEDQLLAN